MPGGTEWLIPLLIILLLFGAKKLPELAGSMGKSIKEFRKATADADAEAAEGSGDGSRGPGNAAKTGDAEA